MGPRAGYLPPALAPQPSVSLVSLSRPATTSGEAIRPPRRRASMTRMGSTVEKIRVRPPRTPRRPPTRRPPARRGPVRAPAGQARQARPIPETPFDAFRRARRRRFVARRAACVLALCSAVALFLFGTLTSPFTSSERGHVRSVMPVEAAALPVPPLEPPPDMGRVWAEAVARDPSTDLATGD